MAPAAEADPRWLDTLGERARDRLPAALLEYVLQGARESLTAGAAVAAWRDVRLLPRVLHDVTHVETSVSLLGHTAQVPWGVAPSTLQRAVHPDGELAMARACADAGSVMVASSNAGTPFAEIGATGVHWWLQAYLPADRTLAEPMLDRAVAAGARAVVLTVDTPVVGTKHATPGTPLIWETVDPAMLRVNFDAGYDDQPGAEKALDLGPHDIGWWPPAPACPWWSRACCAPRTHSAAPRPAPVRSGSPTTAVASSTGRRARPRACPTWWRPWATRPRCTSTAASAPASTSWPPSPWAPGRSSSAARRSWRSSMVSWAWVGCTASCSR